jgi:mannose-6-phosphate isomerase-like protein (cupin superfamily)
MPIEIIDTVEFAHKTERRTVVLNTNRFHAWVHYYKPDQQDEMHCHNQDQTFQIVEGQCTMRFPDGGEAVLTPGMLATITGGSFYQLHNTGGVPLVMIGTRSGSTEETVKVEHGTGRIIKSEREQTAASS